MYLIDTPPPTISGDLHIGHIFSYTVGDVIARYQQYKGEKLIYPFCYDNNGIPTAKLASKHGITNPEEIKSFSDEKADDYFATFIEAGIEFKSSYYSSYNAFAVELANKAFKVLRDKGIAYKAKTEALWSEKLQTSISQSELDEKGIIERTGEKPIIKEVDGWFINIKDHLPEIRKKVDEIHFNNQSFKNKMYAWIDQVEYDWSISRNRNFGIPIPDEEMTFDTWFISALSPQMAWSAHLGVPSLECPVFDMRFQAHDIIRTWAFYTVAMSYFLNDQIPWKNLIITGHVLDGKGDKFSKSNGNAKTAKAFIDKHKVSGLRHWAISSEIGTDVQIDENRMKMGYRIRNKFKNVCRFIEMQEGESIEMKGFYDCWKIQQGFIIDSLEKLDIVKARQQIETFLFDFLSRDFVESSKVTPCHETLKKIISEFEPLFNVFYGEYGDYFQS